MVTLGYTGFLISFPWFYWVILGYARFYWVFLGLNTCYLVELSVMELYWVSSGRTGPLPSFPEFFFRHSFDLFWFEVPSGFWTDEKKMSLTGFFVTF